MTNNQPEVYKVIGAPGTGKTTRVVGNPELGLDGLFLENMDEYPLDSQMLVTYTNAGVDEAAERLKKMLDKPKTHIDDRVTTIHSQCYSLLDSCPSFNGMDREQIVQSWDKKSWCDDHDLEMTWGDDEDDIMGSDAAEGNALFQIYDWLQNNRKSISEWEDCPVDWTGEQDPEFLMEQWEQYKDEEDLVGFGDMILEVVKLGERQIKNLGWTPLFDEPDSTKELFESAKEHPKYDPEIIRGKGAFVDTEVLYVDEVQDLTPLQWEWYLLQKLASEKVYIGGDDDQTIYGWSGADPNFMLNEEGDFEVLDKTYRIPEPVWNACDEVIQQVDDRQEKEVEPEGEEGEVINYRNPRGKELLDHINESEDVFVLFRARYMVDEFREFLHEQGIPYDNMSTHDTWSSDVINVTRALGKIEEGSDTISFDEAEALIENMADQFVDSTDIRDTSRQVFDKWNGIDVEEVGSMFSMPGLNSDKPIDYKKYLKYAEDDGELNYYECNAIRGVLENNSWDRNPDNVRIGTIHSSKGKEADTVILALDSTGTILEEMHADLRDKPNKTISDAERRVYYVGMSRSSRKLVLCEGLVDNESSITLSELYGRTVEPDNVGGEQYRESWAPQ